eukprot:TRINITY_DN62252_c0_g1_i1.p2 TRINITY_DN62252_c0_g1~~TRINITY_DN62252_c0_g1_i1.p2  ORF type:complete len:176 (-),score=34.93 TRINITY_DN62252_c0_g1_i1:274-801(-)
MQSASAGLFSSSSIGAYADEDCHSSASIGSLFDDAEPVEGCDSFGALFSDEETVPAPTTCSLSLSRDTSSDLNGMCEGFEGETPSERDDAVAEFREGFGATTDSGQGVRCRRVALGRRLRSTKTRRRVWFPKAQYCNIFNAKSISKGKGCRSRRPRSEVLRGRVVKKERRIIEKA